uniref:Uncharacterized protein n=1 Tax=Tanacetum cinerariifolium TaxID=118510 RepID=A0A6L2NHS8_TANCI|nr:hypothetical protein [Tanacetum cinerariifolium]
MKADVHLFNHSEFFPPLATNWRQIGEMGSGIELLILKELVEKLNFLGLAEFTIDDPAVVVTVKPATKQTMKNIANE